MSSTPTSSRSRKGLALALVGFMALLLGLALGSYNQTAQAQTATTAATTSAATTAAATTAATTTSAATTAAGTTGPATTSSSQTSGTTITVFCLDYGKTFPTGQTIKAQGLASDKVRGGLTYALSKGYVTSNPYQVQLAMWNLQDNQPFHDSLKQGTTIAQEIVTNAGAAPSGDASAIANLTLTNVKESSPQAAYGTATVQGNANTQGLPVGFLLPASASTFQNLVAVVATGNGAATTAAATTAPATTTAAATTAAATTAPATTTAATTRAATTAPATTVAPTATVGGQGGAPAPSAPATGLGGSSDDSGSNVVIWLVALLALIGLTTFGLKLATRKSR